MIRSMKEFLYERSLLRKGSLLLIVPYAALFAVFLVNTPVSMVKIITAIGIIAVQAVRYFIDRLGKSDTLPGYLPPVIQFIFIIVLFYGTHTDIESIIFTFFTIDVIMLYQSRFGVSLSYIGFTIYLLLWRVLEDKAIADVISSFNYCVFIGLIWGVKVLLLQRDTIVRLNKKILEQSSVMEDLAKLKERNRIAEEVHNTVGHKLTTAIVSLEGAHLLFEKNPGGAHEKLNVARKQLKEGLGDIREVVRALDSGGLAGPEGSLRASIEHLVRDTEVQTGIRIRFYYDLSDRLLSLQEHVLLNAAKEGITNAIRHAEPGRIGISLTQSDGQAILTVENDGSGCETITEGFGLKAIRENAEAIGGKMKYECRPEGFALSLYIPIVSEE